MNGYAARLLCSYLACAGVVLALKVSTDYNHATDFSRYRTYSWLAIESPDPFWPERIRNAVDAQLLNRGWKKVSANGDALVSAVASTELQPRWQTYYQNFGGWYYNSSGTATTTLEYEPFGTIVVSIMDKGSKKVIWRGTSTDDLSRKAEKNTKKLQKAVNEMFEKFPPRPKT